MVCVCNSCIALWNNTLAAGSNLPPVLIIKGIKEILLRWKYCDVGTDMYLAMGKLKDTSRYKEAGKTLDNAKHKYGVDSATVTGHSLGGAIAQYMNSKNDNARQRSNHWSEN
jgi:hypothetical protein